MPQNSEEWVERERLGGGGLREKVGDVGCWRGRDACKHLN